MEETSTVTAPAAAAPSPAAGLPPTMGAPAPAAAPAPAPTMLTAPIVAPPSSSGRKLGDILKDINWLEVGLATVAVTAMCFAIKYYKTVPVLVKRLDTMQKQIDTLNMEMSDVVKNPSSQDQGQSYNTQVSNNGFSSFDGFGGGRSFVKNYLGYSY